MYPAADIGWKSANAQVESHGPLTKKLRLRFENLCARYYGKGSICFDRADSMFTFQVLPPRLIELGPVQTTGGIARFSPDIVGLPLVMRVPGWLSSAELKPPMLIEINRWHVTSDSREITGDYRLQSSGQNAYLMRLSAKAARGLPSFSILNTIHAVDQSKLIRGPWVLDGEGEARLPGKAALRNQLQAVQNKGADFDYRLALKYVSPAQNAWLNITGLFVPGREISGTVNGLGRLNRLSQELAVEDCRYHFDFGQGLLKAGTASLDFHCPARIPLKLLGKAGVGPKLSLISNGHIQTLLPPDKNNPITGEITINPQLLPTAPLKTQGGLRLHAIIIPAKPIGSGNFGSKLNLKLKVPRFDKLVRALAKTRFPVPAPFDVLKGTVEFSLQGNVSPAQSFLKTRFRSRLASPNQRADVQGRGWIAAAHLLSQPRIIRTKADFVLNDVQFAAPPVGLSKPPLPIPDPRIQHSPVPTEAAGQLAASRPFELHYDISVKTAAGHPLRVLWQYADAPIPLELNASTSDKKPLAMALKIGAFPFDLLGNREEATSANIKILVAKHRTHVEGSINLKNRKEPVQLLTHSLSTTQLAQPSPKLPLPFVEVLSSSLGLPPLEIAVAQPVVQPMAQPVPRQVVPSFQQNASTFQIRYRY